jgi:hypothetical protein
MFRILAVIAFLVAVVLFVVVAIASNVDPHIADWGFVSLAAGLACLALEPLVPAR